MDSEIEGSEKISLVQDRIIYIPPPDLIPDASNAAYSELSRVFSKFLSPAQLSNPVKKTLDSDDSMSNTDINKAQSSGATNSTHKDEEKDMMEEGAGKVGLSRKERKMRNRLDIAELKQLVERPDVVEIHDSNSSDPKLLVYLKSYRNTVAVPRHWSQKRKYLQGKRGIEKPPFTLPAFIADTGIMKIRNAQEEKDKKSKSRQRERMQPKLGKIDIDYQVLHDAFFRYQTKPPLTAHGDLYYEGKENEVKMKEKKPGMLSEELRTALGMSEALSPPPWLQNMQRFGPPPSYPSLKISGVNCPIPEGARWGFNEGEWGQAPLDAYGRPLYGDVYGKEKKEDDDDTKVEKTLWGTLLEEEEEEEEEAESSDEELPEQAIKEGTESVSSVASGVETPEAIPLRKTDGTGTETPEAVRTGPGYTVLEQKPVTGGTGFFPSQHTYVLGSAAATSASTEQEKKLEAKRQQKTGQVDVALKPEELENLDAATLKRKYEQQLETEKANLASQKQDVSDVFEEENRKKKRKLNKEKKKTERFKF